MMVGFLAEPALLMVLFTASLISGSTSLSTIVQTLAHKEFVIYPSMRSPGGLHHGLAGGKRAHPRGQSGHALELTMITRRWCSSIPGAISR